METTPTLSRSMPSFRANKGADVYQEASLSDLTLPIPARTMADQQIEELEKQLMSAQQLVATLQQQITAARQATSDSTADIAGATSQSHTSPPQSDDKPFGFMRLPPGMRDMVYDLLVGGREVLVDWQGVPEHDVCFDRYRHRDDLLPTRQRPAWCVSLCRDLPAPGRSVAHREPFYSSTKRITRNFPASAAASSLQTLSTRWSASSSQAAS